MQPNFYVEGTQFGKIASPTWQAPAEASNEGLTAAVIQHVHASKIIAAIHAASMNRAEYAREIGRSQSTVAKHLGGQRVMSLSDIGDAVAYFGDSVLPTPKEIKAELTRARSMTGLG